METKLQGAKFRVKPFVGTELEKNGRPWCPEPPLITPFIKQCAARKGLIALNCSKAQNTLKFGY